MMLILALQKVSGCSALLFSKPSDDSCLWVFSMLVVAVHLAAFQAANDSCSWLSSL
jgi:hypothetical protein